ncbi:hypothetical protein TrRE_jg10798 [Triparma retinervis]|uniref:6,7-dimethyl-8-ribityllumazine synthase n=1 Tax=Triparma retinervis TaxID=2557542 RepID=A0A9W7AF36_9STRA|nr:hypothetical protein TrRE_jg10798 [Triparma retinervis]
MFRLILALAALASASAFQMPTSVRLSRSILRAVDSNEDLTFPPLDGSKSRIGIIRTRWNENYVSSLVDGIKESLKECGVEDSNVFVTEVPGAYELPYAARLLAFSGTVDSIVAVGTLIKGDTQHFEYIADATSNGLMSVGLQTNVPVVFGVLTCNTEEQVKKRAIGKGNHGQGWGKTAVEMALLRADALGGGKPQTMGFGELMDVGGGSSPTKPRIGF